MKIHLALSLSLTLLVAACQTLPTIEVGNDSAEVLYQKGMQYLMGHDVPYNHQKAIAYFKAAGDQGYAPAYNALGVIYDQGNGTAMNKSLAFDYYEAAATLGLAPAQYNLALFYYQNDRKNPLMMDYLNRAIAQNDENALALLGKIEWDQANYRKAHQHLSQAAKHNNPDALFFLALMHKEGQGIPKNIPKAIEHLIKAADLHQVEAQFILGTMYLQGEGVPKDPAKAFHYLDKAATQRHTKAMVNVAIMLVKGEGTEVNLQKAAYLFKIAADQGNDQAKEVLKTLHAAR